MTKNAKTPEVAKVVWQHRLFLEHELDDGCIRIDKKDTSGKSSNVVVFTNASNAPWHKLWFGDGHVNVCLWNEYGGVQLSHRVGNERGALATARRH